MQRICVEIGKNLRRFRQEQNLSCEELAHRAFISDRYLRDLELGKSFATVKVYYKITKALHLPLRRIFDGVKI
jgi:transcriptional regulator with XRE-family HTH domain